MVHGIVGKYDQAKYIKWTTFSISTKGGRAATKAWPQVYDDS